MKGSGGVTNNKRPPVLKLYDSATAANAWSTSLAKQIDLDWKRGLRELLVAVACMQGADVEMVHGVA